jgi:hypothetical protein
MARPRRTLTPEPPRALALPLPDMKKHLRRYYAGERMRSPQGGLLEVVRIQTGHGEREPGRVLMDCMTSSLRYELTIPAATKAEREAVRTVQSEGRDPSCPRHGAGARLLRAGSLLVCPSCGVAYGRMP